MKKYTMPEVEVIKFKAEDIMTTSNPNPTPVEPDVITENTAAPAAFNGTFGGFMGFDQ